MAIIRNTSRPRLAILVDPEKPQPTLRQRLERLAAWQLMPDMVLLGGSTGAMDNIETIHEAHQLGLPVVLFPGNPQQLSAEADELLLPQVISSRNAEMLIGQHVEAAHTIRQLGIDICPLGYILIDGGRETTVQRISDSRPLPQDDIDLVVRTAIAGELTGCQAIYLEAGSGALQPVRSTLIRAVREAVRLPLIVGGGLRTSEAIQSAWQAGADIVVIGNMLEQSL